MTPKRFAVAVILMFLLYAIRFWVLADFDFLAVLGFILLGTPAVCFVSIFIWAAIEEFIKHP